MSKDGKALRYNSGKLRMELVPISAIRGLAEVFGKGAEKYAPRNWEKGFKYSVPYACLLRHLTAFWGGEDLDKETGLSHMKHVLANAAMLVEFLETYPEGDDRPVIDEDEPAMMYSRMVTEEELQEMANEYDSKKGEFKYEGSSL